MSYAGGTVTQPILGGFGDLANILLQGSSEIAQINLEVGKRRDKQAADLAERISKITSTGITTHDRLIQAGARDAVNQLYAAFEANKRGDMSLSDVSALYSQLDSEMGIMASMSKLQDENLKNVSKGIEDESLDSISFDFQNSKWYNDPNLMNDVYLTPAIDSEGNIKKNPDGTDMMVRRPAIEGLQYKRINGIQHVVKLKEVPKRDENGDVMYDANGAPLTTNKAFVEPLTDFLNPSLKKVERYDLVDDVKGFQAITGDRFKYINKETGAQTDMPYSKLGDLENGTIVYGYTIDPENFPDMIRKVETYIGKPKDDEVISILHSYMGARADWQPDYGLPRTADEVNNDTMMEIMVNGELNIIPKYYDVNGEPLQFTSDPLDLQTDGSGKIIITDEQRELAKAFKRDHLLKSFNVEYKDYKAFLTDKKTSTKIPSEVDFTTANYVKKNADGSINNSAGIDAQYLRNKISIAAGFIDDIKGDMSSNFGSNLLAQHQRGDKIESTVQLSGQQALLSERAPNIIGGVNLTYMSTPTKSGDAVLNYVTQDIKGTTITGGKLKSLGQIMVFDEGVDSEGDDTPIMVVLSGQVDLGKTSIAATEQVIGGTAGVQRSRTISAEDFYIVESATELNSLYKMLWRQGDSPNSFKTILENKGYNIDGKKSGGKKDMLQAFKEYMNEVKTM
jgi:hypothetical protein